MEAGNHLPNQTDQSALCEQSVGISGDACVKRSCKVAVISLMDFIFGIESTEEQSVISVRDW